MGSNSVEETLSLAQKQAWGSEQPRDTVFTALLTAHDSPDIYIYIYNLFVKLSRSPSRLKKNNGFTGSYSCGI